MKQLAFFLDQMNLLLDQLIDTAKALRDLSVQVISEEELNGLQIKQKNLLTELESADQTIETKFWNEIEEKDHIALHAKVNTFKALNQEFIQNLKESHGLIQFEMSHLPAQEEEIEQFAPKLNKMPLSPNRAQTVDSKKAKKS